MYIENVGAPLVKKQLDAHNAIKEILLSAIEHNGRKIKDDDSLDQSPLYTNITKTDYNFPLTTVPYKEHFFPHLDQFLKECALEFDWTFWKVHNVWFQQYVQGSSHGYHTHTECQFTGVYYLEFPEGSPCTDIIHPFDKLTVRQINVAEGDIIIFPSFMLHRAPLITNDLRKTIISFNMSFSVTPVTY